MNADRKRAYSVWSGIKDRCYNKNVRAYEFYGKIGVTLCDEWLNFENFYKWYMDNYYEIENGYMCVDKDILDRNNKVYCPEKCLIVPIALNNLFVDRKNNRGKCKIGLQARSKSGFQVKVRNPLKNHVNEYYGTFKTEEAAIKVYCKVKEEIIKGMAEEYKDKVPEKVYNALINYRVNPEG